MLSARERLLTATATLTYERGIAATGVDAIAQAAGVTKRTLYQRFGSKDRLVAEALAVRHGPVLGALRERVLRRAEADGSLPALALFDVLERLFSRTGWRGCAFLNAGVEVADPAHPLHAVVADHLAARRALVAELLALSGRADDAALLDALALLVEGAFALSAVTGGPDVAARARRGAERLLG